MARSRWGLRDRFVAGVLALVLPVAGCAAGVQVRARKQGVAQVRVESDPAGAKVLVKGRVAGTTPTVIALPYVWQRESYTDPSWQTGGGVMLGLGALVASLGGIVAFVAGVSGTVEAEVAEQHKPYVVGGGIAAAVGGVAMLVGLVLLATARRERSRLEPADALSVGLQFTDGRKVSPPSVDVVGATAPDFASFRLLRYEARAKRWEAPGASSGFRLRMRGKRAAPRPVEPLLLPVHGSGI